MRATRRPRPVRSPPVRALVLVPFALVLIALGGLLHGSELPRACAEAVTPPAPAAGVHREAYVDFGPYADYATWVYVVKQGDTLSEIAQDQLGTLRRQAEITAMNPGLRARTMRADQELRMPPRLTPRGTEADDEALAPDARRWWDVYVLRRSRPHVPEQISSGDRIPYDPEGTVLCAVRHEQRATFEQRIRRGGSHGLDELLDELRGEPWFALASQAFGGETPRPEDHRVATILEHHRIAQIADGRITLHLVRTEYLDRQQRPLPETGWFEGAGNLLLLFAGFIGLLGLVIALSRRGRAERFQIPVGS